MRRQWILIDESFLKTIRTIGDKKSPSRGGRNRMQMHVLKIAAGFGRHGDQWVNNISNNIDIIINISYLSCSWLAQITAVNHNAVTD